MRRVSEAVIQDVRKRTAACETGVLHLKTRYPVSGSIQTDYSTWVEPIPGLSFQLIHNLAYISKIGKGTFSGHS
jgi:hypothetical protein